jgi:hypothetical protein
MSQTHGEVLAALANDGSASAVARAAVEESLSRRTGLRFLHVLDPNDSSPWADADADEVTFNAALQAVHGCPRIRFTFESVVGDPVTELVARSVDTALLILGENAVGEGPAHEVARDCLRRAACEVRLVPRPDG